MTPKKAKCVTKAALLNLQETIGEHLEDFSEHQQVTFKQAWDCQCRAKYRTSTFYITMKILKIPIKRHPIIDWFNTELAIYPNKWLDVQFVKLVKNLPTRLKDSQDILKQLITIGYLPPGTRIFYSRRKFQCIQTSIHMMISKR